MVQKAVQAKSFDPDVVRDLDPDVLQRRAANPLDSVWVSASAGSGKTKVLTDRVLRLLLPRQNGEPGTPAHKILGITFTKAAANEMAVRISAALSRWAIMDEEGLREELSNLLGYEPTTQDMCAARQLFADVIDAPGGLKIMTIHAFCQSVLSRFPLEAGLVPYFKVLEENQALPLLSKARDLVLKRAEKESDSPLNHSLQSTAKIVNEQQFLTLLHSITSERLQLQRLVKKHFGMDGLYTELCTNLGLQPGQTADDILQEGCADKALDKGALHAVIEKLEASKTKTDQTTAGILKSFLAADTTARTAQFKDYASAFLTQKDDIKRRYADNPAMVIEAERILRLKSRMAAAYSTEATRSILILGQAIIDQYQSLKSKQAVLDFDDLIFKTLELLQKETSAAWVMFKLDQGLDHILVDEAQDTNPEQWQIIETLCSEFFAGQGRDDTTRTLFVVGDEKQSIYSFQRASPEEFTRMQGDFAARIKQAGKSWNDVSLNISFRSGESVLKAVDAVFANPDLHKGLSLGKISHHSYRAGQEGQVELWPLCESEKPEPVDPWDPPIKIIETSSGSSLLADQIAGKIRSWLDNGEELPSRRRSIQPDDIMILVRTRNSFVDQLTRALKTRNIPVSGVDRMVLNDQLAVEDLLAFANFALLPEDDLTLACILKSPLIGFDEGELYDLAVHRSGSLWDELKNTTHKEIAEYLSSVIHLASYVHPYEFFSSLLQQPCPASSISGFHAIKRRLGEEAVDPLDELLNAALQFDHDNLPSLQSFVHLQTAQQIQIKRELKEHNSEVRIMTVHGAKGLQAPIVILPDTTRTTIHMPGQADRRLIWPDKSNLDVPLWAPRKEFESDVFKSAMAKLDERADEEYRRLLYVAMTRAEDRLYVCGYKSFKEPLENSWYYFVKSALQSLPETEKLESGALKLSNPQVKKADIKGKKQKPTSQFVNVPDYLFQPAPEEPSIPTPLVPSRPPENGPSATSPLSSENTYRFKRGNLTHKLLEILPELSQKKRHTAAEDFIARQAQDLPKDVQESILEETLEILSHPNFSKIFGPESMAEVPVTGLMPDGRLISGQIDRLLVTDDNIWIIDYKTNRPPPERPEDVPDLYKRQMKAYADALVLIYPNRAVHTALLWTDGPVLMPITFD